MKYLSTFEVAEKWGISPRRVGILCNNDRIPGAQRELNAALGIELNDLVQEGSLGLLGCISSFQPDYGNKFLTYAAPAIHNAMLDYIRRLNPTFDAKNLDCIIRLDEVKKGENKGQH